MGRQCYTTTSTRVDIYDKKWFSTMTVSYLSSYSADIVTKEENVAEMFYIRQRDVLTHVVIAGAHNQSTVSPPIGTHHWLTCMSLIKWAGKVNPSMWTSVGGTNSVFQFHTAIGWRSLEVHFHWSFFSCQWNVLHCSRVSFSGLLVQSDGVLTKHYTVLGPARSSWHTIVSLWLVTRTLNFIRWAVSDSEL